MTKKPSDVFEADFEVDANDEEQYSINGGISFPIFEEKLGVRINGAYWDEEGFYDNRLTGNSVADDEGWGLSLSTSSLFDNGLSVNFRAEFNHAEGKPSAQVFLPFNTVLDVPVEARSAYLSDPNDPTSPVLPGADIAQCWEGIPQPDVPGADEPDFIGAVSAQSTEPNDRNLVERARRIISPELATQLGFPDPATATDADYAAVIAANPFLSPYCEYQALGFSGQFPDGDDLGNPRLGTDPTSPGQDYEGFDQDYWRVALNAEWALEKGAFNVWAGYLYDDNTEEQDSNSFGVQSANIYGDSNVNSFSFNNKKETTQRSFEIRYATDLDGPVNLSVGMQYWDEDVDNASRSITGQASGSHFTWTSGTENCFPLTGGDDCPGYTETNIHPYQQAAFPYRPESPADRDTEHNSFYGVVDWSVAETLTFTFEGRYSEEEVEVEGPIFYDSGASGGPGGLNPCGIFFRACDPFADWIADGNFFADSFDAQDPDDGPDLIAGIPELCVRQNPNAVQRSIDFGPTDDVNGDGRPDGIDTFNPWCVDSLRKSESYFLPKVILDWAPKDGALLYASWAKARKPGGFSLLTVGSSGLDRELAEFDAEKMDVWEVGANSEWFDSTLRINGAFFFQDFTDKQALTSTLGNDGRLVTQIENASSAEVWGAEVDITWAPIQEFIGGNWTVSGGYQWLDTEYKDFEVASTSTVTTANVGNCVPPDISGGEAGTCLLSYSGNELENAPDGSFVGQVRYDRDLNASLNFFVETDVQWTDERFADISNNYWTDSFWNTDFRIGLQADAWEVLAYVDNVFDDDTVQSSGGGPGLGCCFVLGSSLDFPNQNVPQDAVMVDLPLYRTAFLRPPRVFGVRANYRFGGS